MSQDTEEKTVLTGLMRYTEPDGLGKWEIRNG